LHERLAAIDRALDHGEYQSGQWTAFLEAARGAPRAMRSALARDVTRVSSKLHRRRPLHTCSAALGYALEIAATAVGGALLWLGATANLGVAAVAGLLVWITTFEPLLKVIVGWLLGVRYEYAYLFGIEPRFKMQYGTYLAASRPARIGLQLSGCVGSPLATVLVDWLMPPRVSFVHVVAEVLFWILVAVNAAFFLGGLCGIRRVGRLPLSASSGGAAGVELRESFAPCA